MTNGVSLVVELARAVAMGHLTTEHARAALANALVRECDMEGNRALDGLEDRLRLDCHFLTLHVERLERGRDLIAHAIGRATNPMIDRQTSGRIRAHAHDVNVDRGRLLTEDEVDMVVASQLRARQGRAGGVLAPAPSRRRKSRRYG